MLTSAPILRSTETERGTQSSRTIGEASVSADGIIQYSAITAGNGTIVIGGATTTTASSLSMAAGGIGTRATGSRLGVTIRTPTTHTTVRFTGTPVWVLGRS